MRAFSGLLEKWGLHSCPVGLMACLAGRTIRFGGCFALWLLAGLSPPSKVGDTLLSEPGLQRGREFCDQPESAPPK